MRLALGFDATAASGRPYFSPERPRIADPEIRRKLAGYLCGGRLAVRAGGLVPDPLAPDDGPVVPTGYRTDGRWVWQEALAYYARRHGIAPEPDFLTDIVDRGFRPPGPVRDRLVARAAQIALGPGPDLPPRWKATYYAEVDAAHPAAAPLSLMRRLFTPGGGILDQGVHEDLRWHGTDALLRNERSPEYDLEEITEEQAARVMDRWCAMWSSRQLDRSGRLS